MKDQCLLGNKGINKENRISFIKIGSFVNLKDLGRKIFLKLYLLNKYEIMRLEPRGMTSFLAA